MTNFETQAKERARQQKQMSKEAKRRLFRQQKMSAVTGAPNIHPDGVEPASIHRTGKGED